MYCSGGQTAPNGPCASGAPHCSCVLLAPPVILPIDMFTDRRTLFCVHAGHYCPPGTSSPSAFACLAGTYTARTDLQSYDQCSPCPTGQYCVTGSSAPTACPAGTYTNVTNTASAGSAGGATSFPACTTCPAGHYCRVQSVSPVPCGAGNTSSSGASSCAVCTVGHFCDQDATSFSVMMSSKVCPAGLYCPAGLNKVPEYANEACPVGHYCVAGVAAPVACPAGRWNPITGAQSLADCLICPAGSYCEQASFTVTGTCAPGYYCPAGSTTNSTFACPTKYYRSDVGGRSLQDCAICPSGSFCGVATIQPTPCTAGGYCVTGVDVPENCPPGTFGNSSGLRRVEDCAPCRPGTPCAPCSHGVMQRLTDCFHVCVSVCRRILL